MALIVADRIQETSSTAGTGNLTLLGATTGYRAASTVCANGDTFTYYAEDIDALGRPLGAWETGLGTWGTGNILTRTTIYASSNGGAAVSWAAGTRRIGLGLVSNAALGPTTIAGNISATNLSGTNTGDQTNISGNSGTSTKLATARTINGVAFDGSANITVNAVDATARIASTEKGAVNGVATLDASGLVPVAQLPSYVDDVLEYANLAGFPASGVTGRIYVALDTNKTYRWGGSSYVYITSGAVDSVAGKTGVVALVKGDVGLANVDNTADSAKSVNFATSSTNATNLTGIAPTCGYSSAGNNIGFVGIGGPQIMGDTTTAAMLSFHRAGAYAVNFGLDTDNVLKVGGWSMGAVSYAIYHTGNLTNLNQLTNGPGYTTNTGTVTSVVAGDGMTQTGTPSVNPTLNVVSHAGTAGSIGTINVGADAIGVDLGTTSTTAARGDHGHTLAAVTAAGNTATNNIILPGAEGNAYGFWGGTTDYSIAMGVTAGTYQYGPVTDYSIKTCMRNGPGRGFTWGQYGVKPIAALNATSGDMQIAGVFSAAAKNFLIPHPTKSDMQLRYGSLESPYHGVRLTGTGLVVKGKCTVKLPDYIYGLCKQEGAQVQITNIKHGKVLWVQDVDVQNNEFTVEAKIGFFDKKEYEFFWSFTGIRKDISDLIVESE